jgi:hypothetical protein
MDPRWAEDHDLSASALTRLVHRLARIIELVERHDRSRGSAKRSRGYLLALLRIENEYGRLRGADTTRGARADAIVLENLERLGGENEGLLRRLAKLWCVVDQAAKARGVDIKATRDRLQSYADQFRLDRGLESAQATRAWLRDANLGPAGFAGLVTDCARRSLLLRNSQVRTFGADVVTDVCWFHDALRLTGFYRRLKSRREGDRAGVGTGVETSARVLA